MYNGVMGRKNCKYDGCDRFSHGLGYCKKHYARVKKGAPIDDSYYEYPDVCKVEGCEKPHSASGYCKFHYNRFYKGIPMDYVRGKTGCDIEGCDRPHQGKGMCIVHYDKFRKGLAENADQQCIMDDCKNYRFANKMCRKHYRRKDPYKFKKKFPMWSIRPDYNKGYLFIKVPADYPGRKFTIQGGGKSGLQFHHVHVMEKKIGRPLKKSETVHHKNGIKTDNRINNLELWCSNHSSGQRVKDLLDWAKTIIKEYGDLDL